MLASSLCVAACHAAPAEPDDRFVFFNWWTSPGELAALNKLVAVFTARYPDVTIDLVMNDTNADLVEEGIDLAIRSGEVTDSALIARKIGVTRRVVVASPSYLRGKTLPKRPGDLGAHDCITFTGLTAGVHWRFEGPGPDGAVSVEVKGPVRTRNSEGIREAVLSGLGIGYAPVWHFTDEIEKGRLVALLDGYEPKPEPIHAVYPSRRFVPQKTRAMIDFLEQRFAMDPKLSIHPVRKAIASGKATSRKN